MAQMKLGFHIVGYASNICRHHQGPDVLGAKLQ